MTGPTLLQIGLYLVALTLLAVPLGAHIARVESGRQSFLHRAFRPIERAIYRIAGVREDAEMTWSVYAGAVLIFHVAGLALVFALQRLQHLLPLNPDGLPAVPVPVAFNTAVSFITNTNWQSYGGETTMSYFTQMVALTVQNFVSAASGIAVLFAFVRGFARREVNAVGNFWVDLTRSTLFVLLPLSLLLAVVLVSQGVVQTFDGAASARLLDSWTPAAGEPVLTQTIARGPAASQVAIKQLGTNGGGFFNVNSAHPLENPTPLSNFLELLAILLIPAALCFTFGSMVRDRRQGWAVYAVMLALFLPLLAAALHVEQSAHPAFAPLGVDAAPSALQPGGNMEGKEARFGIGNSVLWAVATTAASNGSVNSMHDSFLPLAGLVPMVLMQLGEVAFGGVGSGLYGLLAFALVAVFISGLMVGRTPEYLGKKIEAFEMQMATVAILLPCCAVLLGTALACALPDGSSALGNPGAHGFSEILYAFSSASNNNGSAFGGLTASGVFYSVSLGACMLIGRFGVMLPLLAAAGSLARKKSVPPNAGTLPTHGPLFILLLGGVVVLVGALTFVPALALGPVMEHFLLHAR